MCFFKNLGKSLGEPDENGVFRDENGNVEHLFDEPMFDEDADWVDELNILDMLDDD
ncbi:MAG: hypothetical protein IK036_04385 [Clostridia bacterium]|nr:hypothetical protein [Clostridia bacterium]MBR5977226.1 hypothetical protein [Clostridia bacterium]MBR5991975.1 hypothetical protein [Clostridia bacterium]